MSTTDQIPTDAELFASLIPERIVMAPEDFDALVALIEAPPVAEQCARLERLLSSPSVWEAR